MLSPMMGASFTRRRCAVVAGGLLLGWSGPSVRAAQNGIEIENIWIRPASKASPTSMAFFEVVNHTESTEYLLGVTSPAGEARLNALHWHGSNVSVEELKSVAIPGLSRMVLKPGETYITLREGPNALHIGQSVKLSLRFETAGNRDVSAEVVNQLLGNRR
jgi:copper(I)-binding protein